MRYILENEFKYNWMDAERCSFSPYDTTFILEKRVKKDGELLENVGNYIEVPLQIRKVDENGISKRIEGVEVEFINRWLFGHSSDRDLEFQKRIYKGLFRKGYRWKENASNGELDVIFTMVDNAFAYSRCDSKKIRDSRIVKIDNKSNAIDSIETELCINLIDSNTSSVTIENLTNRNKMILTNLESKECLYINGQNKYIVSKIDRNRNIYPRFQGQYIKLNKGVNEIKITTNGLNEIEIIHQPIFINESEVLQCPEIS
ncbi:hypothetical protein GCM10008908_09060 [Clostridium subterminale]|uniref:Phage tail-like C-terminal domain-containing protein n=1 Tax=Clostridium subterminale TaxID=1550 RepID=A0ABN1KJW5_CLOSU